MQTGSWLQNRPSYHLPPLKSPPNSSTVARQHLGPHQPLDLDSPPRLLQQEGSGIAIIQLTHPTSKEGVEPDGSEVEGLGIPNPVPALVEAVEVGCAHEISFG